MVIDLEGRTICSKHLDEHVSIEEVLDVAVCYTTVDHLALPVLLIAHLEDRLPCTFIAVHIPLVEEEIVSILLQHAF